MTAATLRESIIDEMRLVQPAAGRTYDPPAEQGWVVPAGAEYGHQKALAECIANAVSDEVGVVQWQSPVLDRWDADKDGLPSGPSTGDRYLCDVAGSGWVVDYIYEWTGSAWSGTAPVAGMIVYVTDESILYVYTGAAWSALGVTISHASLTGVSANQHHNQQHALTGGDHTATGLTSGWFLKATSPTSFAFGAHGLGYADVGAAASSHNHDASYAALGHNHDGAYAVMDHNHDAAYAALGHTHNGDTLQLDGVNSNGGAFAFTTSGQVTFSNALRALRAGFNVDPHTTIPLYTTAAGYTDAQFGSSTPVYMMHYGPRIGLNCYYDGGYKYGAGSSGYYAAYLDFGISDGSLAYYTTAATGNAAAAATMALVYKVSRAGVVTTGDGAVGAPAWAFTGDTDTGAFRPSADAWDAACGGRSIVRFDKVGVCVSRWASNLITTPLADLHIVRSNPSTTNVPSDSMIALERAGDAYVGFALQSSTQGGLAWGDGDSANAAKYYYMHVTDNHRWEIGGTVCQTLSATALALGSYVDLVLVGGVIRASTSDGSDNQSVAIAGGGALGDTRGACLYLYGEEHAGGAGGMSFVAGESGDISFLVNAGERLKITSAGDVKVSGTLWLEDGITAPTSSLSGMAGIYVDSSDGDLKIRFADGTVKTIVTDT